MRFRNGALEYHDDALSTEDWQFPAPLGRRAVVADFTMADVVTVPSHVDVPDVRTYVSVEAARDLGADDTPPPEAADAQGRSDQTFVVDVVVRADGAERRAAARGQDIYAITAFDAPDFLGALSPHLAVTVG